MRFPPLSSSHHLSGTIFTLQSKNTSTEKTWKKVFISPLLIPQVLSRWFIQYLYLFFKKMFEGPPFTVVWKSLFYSSGSYIPISVPSMAVPSIEFLVPGKKRFRGDSQRSLRGEVAFSTEPNPQAKLDRAQLDEDLPSVCLHTSFFVTSFPQDLDWDAGHSSGEAWGWD